MNHLNLGVPSNNTKTRRDEHQIMRNWKVKFLQIYKRLQLWTDRASQRHQLRSLDDQVLKDIGITRYEALQEAYKPFWKL